MSAGAMSTGAVSGASRTGAVAAVDLGATSGRVMHARVGADTWS